MHYSKGIFKFTILLLCCSTNFVLSQTNKIDSLSNLVEKQQGEELASTYMQLAKEYLYISPDKTIVLGQKAFPLATQSGKKDLEALANLTIGSGMTFIGDFVKARKYIDEGLKIAKEIDHIEYICSGINALAIYYMNAGDYQKAISYLYKCIEEAKRGHLEKQEAMVHFNIGAIFTSKGEWAKGLNEFKIALEYFKKTKDDPFISKTLTNIAANYGSWGDYKMALTYYERSLNHLKLTGEKLGEASVLNNIGEIYRRTGDYKKALSYFQESQNMSIKLKSKLNQATPLIGKGFTYLSLKNYKLAKQYAKEALLIFEEMQMSEGIARSNLVLGEVALAQNEIQQALNLAFKSKQLADNTGIRDLQEKVYLLLSKIYEKDNKAAEAFKYFKEYSTVKDSLFNDRQSQQLSQFRSELELQDKESEIKILQKDNQIKTLKIRKQHNHVLLLIIGIILLLTLSIAVSHHNKLKKKANKLLIAKNNKILEQHRELIKLNETKDMFLTIISHDLRNPIGAFKDTLDQLADYPEMFTKDTREEIITDLRDEASKTYFLLDNLLVWAKTQRGCLKLKMTPFSINEITSHNIQLYSRIAENKKINLHVTSKNNLTVIADQNTVSLIIRNLISNAIKFTKEGGQIQIKIAPKNNRFAEISVSDNGIGIHESVINRLFDKYKHLSTYGTNQEKGSGLGLILCNEFVTKNGGEMSVTSEINKGSTFTFTLKLAPTT